MKRYKLLKDLPTFKAGDEFFISEKGNLIAGTPEKPNKVIVGTGDFIVPIEVDLIAYAKETLQQFPNILTDWFEEIKEPEFFYYIDEKGLVAGVRTNYRHADIHLRKAIGNYFETKEDAKNSLEAHEKEWKIYFGVEDEN